MAAWPNSHLSQKAARTALETLAGREVLTFRPVGEKAVGKKPQAPLPGSACWPASLDTWFSKPTPDPPSTLTHVISPTISSIIHGETSTREAQTPVSALHVLMFHEFSINFPLQACSEQLESEDDPLRNPASRLKSLSLNSVPAHWPFWQR